MMRWQSLIDGNGELCSTQPQRSSIAHLQEKSSACVGVWYESLWGGELVFFFEILIGSDSEQRSASAKTLLLKISVKKIHVLDPHRKEHYYSEKEMELIQPCRTYIWKCSRKRVCIDAGHRRNRSSEWFRCCKWSRICTGASLRRHILQMYEI